MTRFYISDLTTLLGFSEITESEYYSIFGTPEIRPYVSQLYRGEIVLTDIPENIRAEVENTVINYTERFGVYAKQSISDDDFGAMIKETLYY